MSSLVPLLHFMTQQDSVNYDFLRAIVPLAGVIRRTSPPTLGDTANH